MLLGVPTASVLYALFTSNSFEESINKVISYGGDTDTNACIVGSMAEAMYGIDNELINKAKRKIPNEFSLILDRAYKSKQRDDDEWERQVYLVLKRRLTTIDYVGFWEQIHNVDFNNEKYLLE